MSHRAAPAPSAAPDSSSSSGFSEPKELTDSQKQLQAMEASSSSSSAFSPKKSVSSTSSVTSPVAVVTKLTRASLTPIKLADSLAAATTVGAPTNLNVELADPVAQAARKLLVTVPTYPLIPAFLDRTKPDRGPGAHTIPTRNGMLDEVRAVCSGMEDAVKSAHRTAVDAVIEKLHEQISEAQVKVNAGTEGAQKQLDDYKQQVNKEIDAAHAANESKYQELFDHVESLYNVLDAQTHFLRKVFTEEALAALVDRFRMTEPKEEDTKSEIEPTVKREPQG